MASLKTSATGVRALSKAQASREEGNRLYKEHTKLESSGARYRMSFVSRALKCYEKAAKIADDDLDLDEFLSCLRSSGLLFMITHKARATGKKVEGVGAMRDKELKLVAVNASRTLVERQGRVQGEENGEGVDATC